MPTPGFTNFLRYFKEAAYGTDNTGMASPVEETDFSWQRLHTSNAFSMRPVPQFFDIRAADGSNRRMQTGATRIALAGTHSTLFYPTKAAFLLNAAMNITGSPLNLPSYDLDHFDGIRTRRYTGAMVRQLTFRGDAIQQYYTLGVDWVAQKNVASDPTVAAPTSASFPTASQIPYTHVDTKGFVKVNNLVRVKYSSVELTIENILGMTWDEDTYITSLFWAGRNVTYTLKSQYLAVTDRNNYEAVTPHITNQIKWVKGANSVTLDLKSSNFVVAVNDDLPLDNAEYQTLTINSNYDSTASTDLGFTIV